MTSAFRIPSKLPRKRTEEWLELYRQIFANTNDAILILDIDGRIIEQNPAHRALLGFSDDELLGETPAIYLEGGRDEFGREMDNLLQGGSYRGETRCKTKSATWVFVEVSAAIIRNEVGDILGYVIFKHDITARKQTEGALQESEERFTAFMDNSPVVAFMRDEQGRYVYVNRAFEHLVKRPWREIVGKTPFDIWSAETAGELFETDKDVLTSGRPLELYEKTSLPGGETKEWLAIKFPFQNRLSNRLVGCVAIDATERKSLEEQLRQSQKMEAVGRLAGGVAHDFNNLLTIVSGYCHLLLDSSEVGERERSGIKEIKKASERAALLTRQLLAFSRKQVLAPRVLDLNAVISNLEKMLRRLIGEDVELVTIPCAELGRVKVDPGQVEQIIMNLAVNARDAMPKGGQVIIETANVDLDESYVHSHVPCQPGKYVMLTVSDTGSGMDIETQKHIFEPFFTTKGKGKGTGLGLATVYGIVKQSGGFIWVYSEVGHGSTFKIYLPRTLERGESADVAQPQADPLRGTETILLVEDEEALRIMVRGILISHGYRVMEASNGIEALTLSGQYRDPIHLLLSDVVMPQMSGRELAKRLGRLRPDTKVLYVSGYTDEAIVHSKMLGPNSDFLQKPFTPGTLTRKVRDVLDGRQESKA
ncbi:MAG TPA: PAS domain S-box protein [Terriglobia bacterium]|nr:PAS domain S-box protein [Terriglobia bacterium]